MSYLIGFLTVVLVLDCLLLILLVLMQLPKKDAGAGLAFGGAATDALFGAGTGNILTKATKYATVAFFLLLLVVGAMQSRQYHKPTEDLERALERQSPAAGLPMSPAAPAPAPAAAPAESNLLLTPPAAAANPPVVPPATPPATSAPAPATQP